MRLDQGDNGFSLIELIIVVAIIGILAAIAFSSFLLYIEKSELAKAQSTLRNTKVALQAGTEHVEKVIFVHGWSGASGEPLPPALAAALPSLTVPDRIKLRVARTYCGQSRTMDTVIVYACKTGFAMWWTRMCNGTEFQNPKINVGKGFC